MGSIGDGWADGGVKFQRKPLVGPNVDGRQAYVLGGKKMSVKFLLGNKCGKNKLVKNQALPGV